MFDSDLQQDTRRVFEQFLDAVRFIYASSMSEEALTYRAERGVLERDEQMALLVQRVSGKPYGSFFFPQIAGVGLSYNPYVWDESIDPEAGIMRVVFGLGTRAVNRFDDDYTRLVALNVPEKRPEVGSDEVARYSQRRMDMINLAEDHLDSGYFVDVATQMAGLPLEMFASVDRNAERRARQSHRSDTRPWVITLDKVFADTNFVEDIRDMLEILRRAYKSHVDIEFTANFLEDGSYRINLVQCRPLQVKVDRRVAGSVQAVKKESLVMETHGGIIGESRKIIIDRIIYVVPSVYGHLTERDRYAVARTIGKLNRLEQNESAKNILLIGPGRWGTSTPSLGVPVSFAEINTASVICEMDTMHEGLVPDLSLGTHFFNDLVERDVLYIAFCGSKKSNVFTETHLLGLPNQLPDLLPEASEWSKSIVVLGAPGGDRFILAADSVRQEVTVHATSAE